MTEKYDTAFRSSVLQGGREIQRQAPQSSPEGTSALCRPLGSLGKPFACPWRGGSRVALALLPAEAAAGTPEVEGLSVLRKETPHQ